MWTVAFSLDRSTLASGGSDQILRLWDTDTGECLHVYPPPGLYDGMDISGVKGISDVERATLKLLGAVESRRG